MCGWGRTVCRIDEVGTEMDPRDSAGRAAGWCGLILQTVRARGRTRAGRGPGSGDVGDPDLGVGVLDVEHGGEVAVLAVFVVADERHFRGPPGTYSTFETVMVWSIWVSSSPQLNRPMSPTRTRSRSASVE